MVSAIAFELLPNPQLLLDSIFGWFCSSKWRVCCDFDKQKQPIFLRAAQASTHGVKGGLMLERIRLHNKSSFGWNKHSWWESLTGGKCLCYLPAMSPGRVIYRGSVPWPLASHKSHRPARGTRDTCFASP